MTVFGNLKKNKYTINQDELLYLIKISLHVFTSISEFIKDFYSEESFRNDSNLQDLLLRLEAIQKRIENFVMASSERE